MKANQIWERLFQKQVAEAKRVRDTKQRFAYYTTAATADLIFKNEEIWLRNAACMNDFNEIHHGLDGLRFAYDGSVGDRFKSAFKKITGRTTKELEQKLSGWQNQLATNTFISCVSEHDDCSDQYGRLSMWRAYGHGTGVALILNSTPFLSETDFLKAFSIPVHYANADGIENEFAGVVDFIETHVDLLLDTDPGLIEDLIFRRMIVTALATKHPGFLEEKEWRVFHSAVFGTSEVLERTIETISGVPQAVMKLPLKKFDGEKELDISISNILDEVIIGPTEFQYSIFDSLAVRLGELGIKNPESKIRVSDIPLRYA